MHRIRKFLLITVYLLSTQNVLAHIDQKENNDTYQIGVMVERIQQALQTRNEGALQVIQVYGTDSRYYTMIRGWLSYELAAVESQLHATKNTLNNDKFQLNADFLKQAIRLIDLE